MELPPEVGAAVVERTADGVVLLGRADEVVAANPGALRLLGASEAEVHGVGWAQIAEADGPRPLGEPGAPAPVRLRRPDGSTLRATAAFLPVGPGGRVAAAVLLRPAALAAHAGAPPPATDLHLVDDLTGLLNRRGYLERSHLEVDEADRAGDVVHVVFLDLDGLKQVNDSKGHLAGDASLCRLATAIRHAIRSTDVAGRLGGDEFAITLRGCPGGLVAAAVDRILDGLASPGAGEDPLSVSVGVATRPPRSDLTLVDLLAAADAQMYRSKRGRGAPAGGAEATGAPTPGLLAGRRGEAVVATDGAFAIRLWDEAAERLYGWEAPEVVGRPLADVIGVGGGLGVAGDSIAELGASGRWSGRWNHRHRLGHLIEVDESVTVVRGADGTLASVVVCARPALGPDEGPPDLVEVLGGGGLVVHLQPIVALGTGEPLAVEALACWDHPTLGLLPSEQLLARVEAAGALWVLDDLVLAEATRRVAALRRHPGLEGLRLHVNVSPERLRRDDLPEAVAAALSAAELPSSALCVEVTERSVITDLFLAAERLRSVQALGARVALDDFGTGYASLAYAQHLPVDGLKVDRTFVHRLPDHPGDVAIIRSLVGLAADLGLELVAEGVETPEQEAALIELGVHAAQGYLYGRPDPDPPLLRRPPPAVVEVRDVVASLPPDEEGRLAALEACHALEGGREDAFDVLCELAAQLCATPMAGLSLVGRDHQWFKAAVGLPFVQTSRREAFCAHTILSPGTPTVVVDAALDPRFATASLVVRPPYVRHYAAVPLRVRSGHAVGTLCVLDTRPRHLVDAQVEGLRRLARQAEALLDLRALLAGEAARATR